MSDPDDEAPRQPDRLRELEPAHLAAFTGFRRPQNDAEKGLVAEDIAAGGLDCPLNPALARRVYSGSEGAIYLVPGPGLVCCVAISTSGETVPIASFGPDGVGYARGGPGPEVALVGVLPAGGRDLRILQRSGRSVSVPLSEDDGYWVTVDGPITVFWTQAGRTTQRSWEVFGPHRDPGAFRAYFG